MENNIEDNDLRVGGENQNRGTGSDKQQQRRAACAIIGLFGAALGMLGILEATEYINLFGDEEESRENVDVDTQLFRAAVLTNLVELQESVNFADVSQTPYPDGGGVYNVDIDVDLNCWLIFEDETKINYRLVSSTDNPEPGNALSFKTHERPCGVCSTLQDLGVYLDSPDLTDPVRSCGFQFAPGAQSECLLEIGFTFECSEIWRYNTIYTRDQCGGVCFENLLTPNNLATGGGDNFCDPNDPAEPCQNTINNEPACDDFQHEDGEFRLNPCLQCDECESGPLFQKIAGRTRRNSGIFSGINRPNVARGFPHNYFD